MKPAAYELWVGSDGPSDKFNGWERYSIYESEFQANVTARTINSYKRSPFAKVVPLYSADQLRQVQAQALRDAAFKFVDESRYFEATRLREMADELDPQNDSPRKEDQAQPVEVLQGMQGRDQKPNGLLP